MTSLDEDVGSKMKSQVELKRCFDENFPKSLEGLDKRKEHLSKAIQYLETSYLAAGNNITKQYTVKEDAKKYLVQSLAGVVGDVEAVAANIDACVWIEANAVDALSSDASLIRQRIEIAKESHMRQRYSQIPGPILPENHHASRIIPDKGSS